MKIKIPTLEEWNDLCMFDQLVILNQTVSEKEYIEIVRDWYTHSEFVHQDMQKWRDTFASIKNTNLLMDNEELAFYKNLPDKITIYRGGYSKRGISWTLNKDIAEWFAKRFKPVNIPETVNTKVFKKEVYRDNCIAFFNCRKEEEIIYLVD